LVQRPAIIDVNPWNFRFSLPAKWGGQGTTAIFAARERYEPELLHLTQYVGAGDVAVDAGANRGIYTMVLSRLVGDCGQVVALEPATDPFESLKENVALNRMSNVRAIQAAVSDAVGETILYHHGSGVSSGLGPSGTSSVRTESVATTTLDHVMQEVGLDHIDFLKMDIEGAEELTLRSAGSMFEHGFPTILFEVNSGAARRLGLASDGAWRYLERIGYQFFQVRADRVVPLAAFPGDGNILATHPTTTPRLETP
jgi:FkbM family methyltransferase